MTGSPGISAASIALMAAVSLAAAGGPVAGAAAGRGPVAVATPTVGGQANTRGVQELRRGERLLKERHADAAAQAFEEAARALPREPRASYLLGLAREAAGALPAIVEGAYRDAIARDARFAPAHERLGELLIRDGAAEDARDHLQAAIDADPALAEAHYQLGLLYAQRGRPRAAVVELSRAAALRPREARYHAQLGAAHWLAGGAKAAAPELRIAARLDPRDQVTLARLGLVLVELRAFGEARARLKAALALDAHDATAWRGLAKVALASDRPDQAVELLARARAAAPQDRTVVVDLCEALARERPSDARALDACRDAAAIAPANAELRVRMVELLVARGDCAGARAALGPLADMPRRAPAALDRGEKLLASCSPAAPPG